MNSPNELKSSLKQMPSIFFGCGGIFFLFVAIIGPTFLAIETPVGDDWGVSQLFFGIGVASFGTALLLRNSKSGAIDLIPKIYHSLMWLMGVGLMGMGSGLSVSDLPHQSDFGVGAICFVPGLILALLAILLQRYEENLILDQQMPPMSDDLKKGFADQETPAVVATWALLFLMLCGYVLISSILAGLALFVWS